MLRVYADENISSYLVSFARRHLGWDVLHVCEQEELCGQSDRFHFQRARRQGRVLLTRDKHFLDPIHFPYHKCLGVVIIEGGNTKECLTRLAMLGEFLRKGGRVPQRRVRFAKLIASRRGIRIRRTGPAVEVGEMRVPWSEDTIT